MNEKPTCEPSPSKSQINDEKSSDDLAAVIDPDNFSWIKVKKYVENENAPWKEKYQALEEHHVKETTFLLNKCRELAKKLKDASSWVPINLPKN